MFTPIRGKSVIVTGSSKGIGKGIAKVFAKHGANVLIVGRNQKAAQITAEKLNQEEGKVLAFTADVTQLAEMKTMANYAEEQFGGVDILCSNAGIFPCSKLDEMTEENWDCVLDVNLKGNFLAIKACLPHLKKQAYGRIIMTSSITGPITGFPGWAHYAASKAGMLGFLKTAAIEMAKDQITINAILPGNIQTEGLKDLGKDYLQTMAASIPLKKLGRVEDIGNTALFLASKEAGYITGQSIVVDGGQILPESLEALK
ncbi:MAG: 3-oxoacyl-ACP reductase FabG [Desulfobacteraceae bacterium]|nr:3-oxoacyl-ACP reductase FabG [Desulfobacteraceae bacterium]